jgi:hypothetical protein
VAGTNVWLHLDPVAVYTWFLLVLCGFITVFPVDLFRRLYLLLLDKRPQPRMWVTAVLADPQDGYPEQEEWRLIGTVTERR